VAPSPTDEPCYPVGVAPTLPTLTLADSVVTLSPLSSEHAEALWRTCSAVRETYSLTSVPASELAMRQYIDTALADQARGVALPFATSDARTNRVVGCTRFMNIERWTWPAVKGIEMRPERVDAVEIGATWLAPEAQRTAINTHAKLLMLTHAFEVLEVLRVTLKTDARNLRSRRAIERVGARLDGVLRAHMPGFDGAVRDTAFYSILRAEWPSVREGLRAKAHR
jgi:RimJ/RimL family protein N-acetyltransferase